MSLCVWKAGSPRIGGAPSTWGRSMNQGTMTAAGMLGRIALAGVVLLGLLTVSLSMVSCASRQHFFDVTGELLMPSASEQYEEALLRAYEWHQDAYLTGALAHPFASSGVPPSLLGITYYFESPTNPTAFYALRVHQGTWTSEVISKTPAESPAPIERTEWPLDSIDAWSIALANGGEEFLIEHQEPTTSMNATLLHRTIGEDSLLVWDVDFNILFGPRLVLMIDPKSGEILDVLTR
jgi:hypothetical protein